VGSLTVPEGAGGEKRSLNAQQALATLLSPDRSYREAAYKSLLTRVAQEGPLFGKILNGIMEDHLQEAIERQLPTPLHAMHLKNGVDEEIFRTVIETAEDIDPTIRRYFRLKAQRLGLERLKDTDLLAPWSRDAPRFRFSQAVEILERALGRFHPAFHAQVRECLREGRIDAEVRDGKAGGAFCRTYWPSIPPHIMLGFNGYLRDLVTLAHEMGHGIHYGMASGQTGILFKPPPILAETASTFAEILLYHDLSGRAEFDAYRGDLLASQIEGIYLTISRQKVITRFETALYDVREDHILEEEEICRLWLEEHARLMGEDVERVAGYGWSWAHVPHPFHSPFYCYSYVLGNLLAVRLFQVYMEQGEGFRDEIVRLLGAGGSRDPMELLREMGLDPSRASFWRAAVPYIRRLVDALEALP
jgi:oligoendopeptidase F